VLAAQARPSLIAGVAAQQNSALLVGRGESMHREERLANPDTNPRLRAAQDHTWRWSGAGDSSEPVPTFMLGPFAKVRRV
jgi:hypothetical protein